MKLTAILLNKRQKCRARCPEPKLEDGKLEQERVFTPWGSLLYPSLVCSFLPHQFPDWFIKLSCDPLIVLLLVSQTGPTRDKMMGRQQHLVKLNSISHQNADGSPIFPIYQLCWDLPNFVNKYITQVSMFLPVPRWRVLTQSKLQPLGFIYSVAPVGRYDSLSQNSGCRARTGGFVQGLFKNVFVQQRVSLQF